VEDIENEREILAAARKLTTFTWNDRQHLATWGRHHIATQIHATPYAHLLRTLTNQALTAQT
jgi:hypothetical protein